MPRSTFAASSPALPPRSPAASGCVSRSASRRCEPPAGCGLSNNGGGFWGVPGGLEQRVLARCRSARRCTGSRRAGAAAALLCSAQGCSSRCRWSVPTEGRTCASSPSSPMPRPSSRSSPTSVSHHVHPRSRPLADRPPGTRHPSRCRAGTSSSSPSRTSSLISASPGSRLLPPQRVPSLLISRLPTAPQISSRTSPKRAPTRQRGAYHARLSRLSPDQPSSPPALASLAS